MIESVEQRDKELVYWYKRRENGLRVGLIIETSAETFTTDAIAEGYALAYEVMDSTVQKAVD